MAEYQGQGCMTKGKTNSTREQGRLPDNLSGLSARGWIQWLSGMYHAVGLDVQFKQVWVAS